MHLLGEVDSDLRAWYVDWQSAFVDNVLFPVSRVFFASRSNVKVYELGSLFGATRMEVPQES